MNFPQRILARLLRSCARATVRRYRPLIIGVTGSIGKSTTKEAIRLVVAPHFKVRASTGNYNNELGLPLSILGADSPGRNVMGWIRLFARILGQLLFRREFPEVLILEMGVDHPGDMEYLLSCVVPDIGVVTRIGESHAEFFKTQAAIAREKGGLIAALPTSGSAILNADDERVLAMGKRTRSKIITYGFGKEADIRAERVMLAQEGERLDGLSFKLSLSGATVPVRLPGIFAKHVVEAALAATAVGVALKFNGVDIAAALQKLQPLPGRLRLLAGRDGMRLLDDTYNASPSSVRAALATLREIIAPRRVVIFGDMLELGSATLDEHRALAEALVGSGASVFVAVGQYMQALADALRQKNFPERGIFTFPDPETALRALPDIVRQHDLVLIKGSQGLRMELITASLLAHSEEAPSLLCRQNKRWRETPFVPPAEWTR